MLSSQKLSFYKKYNVFSGWVYTTIYNTTKQGFVVLRHPHWVHTTNHNKARQHMHKQFFFKHLFYRSSSIKIISLINISFLIIFWCPIEILINSFNIINMEDKTWLSFCFPCFIRICTYRVSLCCFCSYMDIC